MGLINQVMKALSRRPGYTLSIVAVMAIASALMAALLVHAGSKCAVALASGGWRYALAVAPGVLAHTLAFAGVLALQ